MDCNREGHRKIERKIIRVDAIHHQYILSCLLEEKVKLEKAKIDFIDRYWWVMRDTMCFMEHENCGRNIGKDAEEIKHYSPIDEDHRHYFLYPKNLMQCDNLKNYLEVFEKIKQVHLPKHLLYHELNPMVGEQHFEEAYGFISKQTYCMFCQQCDYSLTKDLKESLKKTQLSPVAIGIERKFLEKQIKTNLENL